jgi:predicted O-methyltransferase YrrM
MDQHLKWQEDLINDLSAYDGESEFEPWAHPIGYDGRVEFSDCNRASLLEHFLKVRDHCTSILEIGVCRNGSDSSTHVFLENKLNTTHYFGVDIEDKTFLDNADQNIHTIKTSSSNIEEIWTAMQDKGVTKIDFLFIDGWHTINQVKRDWEFTKFLSVNGIVGFHDTSCHPGPKRFLEALDTEKWNVIPNTCPADWGIGFVWAK